MFVAKTLSALLNDLLHRELPSLLERPLNQLGSHTTDESSRAALASFAADTGAATLHDALRHPGLPNWITEKCTSDGALAIHQQLQDWLGTTAPHTIRVDDVARLARVAPIPRQHRDLVRWAIDHRVSGELIRPVSEVLPTPRYDATDISVLDAALGELSLSAHDQHAVRAFLSYEAAKALGPIARKRLWKRASPSAALMTLATPLRQLLRSTSPQALDDALFHPNRPVTINSTTARCCGVLISARFIAVELDLSTHQHGTIKASCSLCNISPCPHIAALAARTLDACLDPTDRLHAPLLALAHEPKWRHFLRAATSPATTTPHPNSLRFHIRRAGSKLEVAAKHGDKQKDVLASPVRLQRSRQLHTRDRPAIQAMARVARTRGGEFVPASLELLRALADHPRVTWDDEAQRLRVIERRIEVHLETHPEGVIPQVRLMGHHVTANSADAFAFHTTPDQQSLVFAPLTEQVQRLLHALETARCALPPESYAELAPWLASLREHTEVSAPAAVSGEEQSPPRKLLVRLQPLPVEGCGILLCIRAFPLSPLWLPGEGDEVTHGILDGRPVYCRRNLTQERTLEARVVEALELEEYVPSKAHLASPTSHYIVSTDADTLVTLERLAQLSDIVDIEWANHDRRIQSIGKVRLSDLHIKLKGIGSVFSVEGSAAFDDSEISLRRLLIAAILGQRFVKLEGRDHVELEQLLIEKLHEAQDSVSMTSRELRLIVHNSQRFLESLGPQIVAADAPTAAWLELLRKPQPAPVDLAPSKLLSMLRPYQLEGARWLVQCSKWASGACLADEMGLGKTIQAIAVLQQRALLGPALVVAPTSLSSNWCSELARFAPDLTVRPYRGAKRRALLAQLGPRSVLVTSYEIAARDLEQLSTHAFATQVLDEAQLLRNARTDRARAMKAIPAQFRIALTGTPIENRLGDLWSLFDMIAPGLLGDWQSFRTLIGAPVERERNDARAARLRGLIGPLFLRRTKSEVASDLPARIEVLHKVSLSPAEQTLYRTAVKRARLALRRLKEETNQHQNSADRERDISIQLLAELTRLRQLACHARLVIPDPRIESSKLNALLRLLNDVLPRGHRALVFSTFTALLALAREALDRQHITSLYLDGSTPGSARGELVDRFQSGEGQVFLVSLKAGGTGLNLTGADYVIHLDLWWNPAAQDQASDRVHRIGQTRPVTIVKLVAEGTIEDRMQELQQHKRWLSNAVLAPDTDSPALDFELLEALLR